VIAEIVERLDEMLRQSEILVQDKFVRIGEDMRHLQCDGFDQRFGVLCEFAVLRRRGPLVGPH